MTDHGKRETQRAPRVRMWTRALLLGLSEMTVAIIVVLLFFVVVIGALTISFPKGTGLSDLYGDLVLPKPEGSGLTLRHLTETAPFVALLSEVRRSVKDRPVDAVAWRYSRSGVSIGDQHAVQTFTHSGAVISFESQGELRMNQNSLVVVRRPDSRSDFRRRRAALIVLRGVVQGTLELGTQTGADVDVLAAGATTRLIPEADEPAQFAVAAHDDGSATLKVFAGAAEVSLGEDRVVIARNHALTYSDESGFGRLQVMPDAPNPLAPSAGFVKAFGALPPRLRLHWSAIPEADAYRVVISRDREFDELVLDRLVHGTELVHGNLEAGEYHWQIFASKDDLEGPPSRARTFRLVEDLEPPALRVSLPEKTVVSDKLLVSGTTDPGAEVLIGTDRITPADSGEFAYAIQLRPGPNLVVVEAVDGVGNVAYHSQYVNAKF